MSGLLNEIVSGAVDAALKEILKKAGIRKTATKRTRRKITARKKASGSLLGDIIEAALKPEKRTAKRRTRKQVSRRRTSASRSTQRAK